MSNKNITTDEFLSEGKNIFCPNHELELYLWKYYLHTSSSDYIISDKMIHKEYQELANQYKKSGDENKFQQTLQKALRYNPTDLDILTALAKSYYKVQAIDKMYQILDQMYPFIYSRNDISQYYCLLGEYYLEKYKPETAEILFRYSNSFAKNEQADLDLKYIEQAVGFKHMNTSVMNLQNVLKKENIPLQPKSETLGLLFETAKAALLDERTAYAIQLLTLLYELTQDKEVYTLITRFTR